jgi:hypothetical protein
MGSCVFTILILSGGRSVDCNFPGFLGHWLSLVSCLWNALLFLNLKRLLTSPDASVSMLAQDERRFHAAVWPISTIIAGIPLLGQLDIIPFSSNGVPVYTISGYGVCNIDLRYDILRFCTQSGVALGTLAYMSYMQQWAVRYVKRTYPHDEFGLRRVKVRGARYLMAFAIVWSGLIIEDIFLLAAPEEAPEIPAIIQVVKSVLFYSQGALNAAVYASNKWHLLREVLPNPLLAVFLLMSTAGRAFIDLCLRALASLASLLCCRRATPFDVLGDSAKDTALRTAAAAFITRARLEATPRTPATPGSAARSQGRTTTPGSRSSVGSVLSDVATAMGDASAYDAGVRRELVFEGAEKLDAFGWTGEDVTAADLEPHRVGASTALGTSARAPSERTGLLASMQQQQQQMQPTRLQVAVLAPPSAEAARQRSSVSTPREFSFAQMLAEAADEDQRPGPGLARENSRELAARYQVVSVLDNDESNSAPNSPWNSRTTLSTAVEEEDESSDVEGTGELDVSLGSRGGEDEEGEGDAGAEGESDTEQGSPIVVQVSSKRPR